ncbi:hypothetical protein OG21DRAFT_1490821 [Imleria badia]|nr:hypothetical protein OG21DRAFT_1490821 [Imleria badia]
MASHPALPGPRSHTLVLATTTTRRSCQHDRQSVVVTTHRPALTLRPPHSGPASLNQPLTLTLTPSCPHTLKLATQSDDDDDATIVPARSSQRCFARTPSHAHPHACNNIVVTTCCPALNPSPNDDATSTPSPTIDDDDCLSVVVTARPHSHSPPQPIEGRHDNPPPPHLHVLNDTTMTRQ